MPELRFCIVTSSNDRYLPGTLVLLHTFLDRNPWFKGDMVVIHDGLAPGGRSRLAAFPRVRLVEPGPLLAERIRELGRAVPALASKGSILHALEAFSLREYDRVLKLDSDVFCAGDAAPLFEIDAGLAACPDRFYFMHMRRDATTYRPLPPEAWGAHTLPVTFNPGVMMIAPDRLPPSTYESLVACLTPSTFARVETGHSDSVILNQHFRDRWTQVSERFNYFIWRDEDRYPRARVPFDEAVFLHFLPKPKPWESAGRTHGTSTRERALAMWDAAARAISAKND